MGVVVLWFYLSLAFVAGFFVCAAVASGKVHRAEAEAARASDEAAHEQSEHLLARQEISRWRDKYRALQQERGRHG